MSDSSGLLTVLEETRRLLARPDNDFSRSSWKDQTAALQEMDAHIQQVEYGLLPNLSVLYAPTGPLQEVSLGSGWAQEFLVLAERFDT